MRTRRPFTRFTKIGLAVVALLVVLETAGFATHYLLVTARYVTTDNAQIDGTAVDIVAPASGTVTRWRIGVGSTLREREVVGRIRVGTQASGPQLTIKSPGRGTVVRSSVTDGQWVTQGTRLATAYEFGDIYVTARVPAGEIGDVRPGARVDMAVDAYPGVTLTGLVTAIPLATADRFTAYPALDSDPTNPQPADRWIPVRVAFTDTAGVEIRPGLSVTARIHRPAAGR
ncbi:HlyD family efflux transporter periplasmic adaptor subunit [Pseudonocardia sp.]|uniref:HlyD family efflux transporter periplasmic adaptor subunit n=1 Tax=Pseudonocardia sp. TaxID=60912 RepID=UPI003D0C57CD